ncbi:MAG: CPBP family intramembrane metalloprotease, partial [Coriobacteriales bacterium]|nr:CPBP family intramembrane metalloprotease [Coriobacteriales bacterium]
EPWASMEGIWLIGIGFLSVVTLAYLALWERMRPRHIGVRVDSPKASALEFLGGYGLGALLMACAVLSAVLLGGFQVSANFSQASAVAVLRIAAIYVFQAFGEEVLYRGAATMCVARRSPALVAVAVSSVLFSAHHHFNGGYGPVAFVNLALLAVLLALTVLRTGRIWMATAIHASWNFFQGNVFGVNVSGTEPNPLSSLLMCKPQDMPYVTGGQMGLEGSLVTTVVLLVFLVIGIIWLWRNPAKTDAGKHARHQAPARG